MANMPPARTAGKSPRFRATLFDGKACRVGKIASDGDQVSRAVPGDFCPHANGEIVRVGIARSQLELFDRLSLRNTHPTARNTI
jgi:hypothetical protein